MLKKNRLRVITATLGLCLAVACSSAQAGFEFSFSSAGPVNPGDTVTLDFLLDFTGADGVSPPTYDSANVVFGLGAGTVSGSTPSVGGLSGGTMLLVFPAGGGTGASGTTPGGTSSEGTLFSFDVTVPAAAAPGDVFAITPIDPEIAASGGVLSPSEGGVGIAAGSISVVPEPSSMLCLVGLGAACGFVRRRRA